MTLEPRPKAAHAATGRATVVGLEVFVAPGAARVHLRRPRGGRSLQGLGSTRHGPTPRTAVGAAFLAGFRSGGSACSHSPGVLFWHTNQPFGTVRNRTTQGCVWSPVFLRSSRRPWGSAFGALRAKQQKPMDGHRKGWGHQPPDRGVMWQPDWVRSGTPC